MYTDSPSRTTQRFNRAYHMQCECGAGASAMTVQVITGVRLYMKDIQQCIAWTTTLLLHCCCETPPCLALQRAYLIQAALMLASQLLAAARLKSSNRFQLAAVASVPLDEMFWLLHVISGDKHA